MRKAAEEENQQPSAVISQEAQDGLEAQSSRPVHNKLTHSMRQAADEENQQPQQEFEAQDGHGSQIPRNTGWLKYVVDYVLGNHDSEPIWRLRLLAAFICVALSMFGFFFLPIYLHEVHETYHRVTAIIIVGAPVVVAVISLFVSFWLPSERTNWVTGLLVVNISLLGGAIVVYLALQNGTGR